MLMCFLVVSLTQESHFSQTYIYLFIYLGYLKSYLLDEYIRKSQHRKLQIKNRFNSSHHCEGLSFGLGV